MNKQHQKILVINLFGIGDVLFSTPMIRALKKRMPEASIDFMCNRRVYPIVASNRNIDDTIIFEKDEFRKCYRKSKIEFAKKILSFVKRLKKKKYDLAIDLSLGYQICLLLKLLGIKKRLGFNYRNRGRFLTDRLNINGFNDKHVVEYYLDILKLIGAESGADKYLELTLPPQTDNWARDFIYANNLEDKKLIGLSPGGGKSWGKYAIYRRWAPENFGYVAKELSKKRSDLAFLVFGSEDEKYLCKTISENLGGQCVDVCGRLDLVNSIALIRKCKLVLCNDGGILHIAVSQDVRTISIFGPVDEKIYGPYPPSGRHKVVKAENCKCRPCYKNFKHSVCNTHNCLNTIDREKVVRLAEGSLDESLSEILDL